jgi:hypothetical protein
MDIYFFVLCFGSIDIIHDSHTCLGKNKVWGLLKLAFMLANIESTFVQFLQIPSIKHMSLLNKIPQ